MSDAPKAGAEMRTFWTLWSGQAFSLVGSQASQFALVWWLTEQTGSPAILSTATLVALLPSVVLGPAIGALVDRWSRRLTMIVADSAVALGSLVLAWVFDLTPEGIRRTASVPREPGSARIAGRAFVNGDVRLVIDPLDPFRYGFSLESSC